MVNFLFKIAGAVVLATSGGCADAFNLRGTAKQPLPRGGDKRKRGFISEGITFLRNNFSGEGKQRSLQELVADQHQDFENQPDLIPGQESPGQDGWRRSRWFTGPQAGSSGAMNGGALPSRQEDDQSERLAGTLLALDFDKVFTNDHAYKAVLKNSGWTPRNGGSRGESMLDYVRNNKPTSAEMFGNPQQREQLKQFLVRLMILKQRGLKVIFVTHNYTDVVKEMMKSGLGFPATDGDHASAEVPFEVFGQQSGRGGGACSEGGDHLAGGQTEQTEQRAHLAGGLRRRRP